MLVITVIKQIVYIESPHGIRRTVNRVVSTKLTYPFNQHRYNLLSSGDGIAMQNAAAGWVVTSTAESHLHIVTLLQHTQ